MMKLNFRLILILILSAAAGACGSYHPVHYYRISPVTDLRTPPSPVPLTVEIGPFSGPSFYQDQMVFRDGTHRMGFYEFSRWIEPPPDLARQSLADMLRSSNRFRRVNIDDNILPADIVFKGRISAFDQVLEGDEVYAEFSMTLEAIRSDTVRVIWSYSPRVRVKQEEEGKFAAAMSQAVGKGLTEALDDLDRQPVLRKMVEEKETATGEKSDSSPVAEKKGGRR